MDNSLTPSKIVCIGRNYVAHIRELGNEVPDEMVVFLKPPSAIASTLIAYREEPIHYEGEITFRIGRDRHNQLTYTGVAFGLDLTKRLLQSKLKQKGLPWERAKAFDGSAIFSDFIPLPEDCDYSQFSLTLEINGSTMQSGSVTQMMYKPETILAHIQTFMTLAEGDLVMTGTPKGVGVVQAAQVFTGVIHYGEECLVSGSWVAE